MLSLGLFREYGEAERVFTPIVTGYVGRQSVI